MSSISITAYNGLTHLMEAATALTELTEPMETNQDLSPVIDDDCRNKQRDSKIPKKKDIFPQKLMEILCDPSLTDIVAWLPHGRSFVIIRPDKFTEQVLPKYMPAIDASTSTKYPSFTRKLNRWYVAS